MVDSISSSITSVSTTKIDPTLERRDSRVEQSREDDRRTEDVVQISEEAQSRAAEETARVVREQVEQSEQPLSGGRVDALV